MSVPSAAAERIIDKLRAASSSLACAESLTGGLLCSALVDVPGASEVFRGGVVAYRPEVKASVLGVSAEVLERHGTVHESTAGDMARGVARLLDASYAVATTGVAGPGSAEGHLPGTVVVAVREPADGAIHARRLSLEGDRDEVRNAAVAAALSLLLEVLGTA